MSAGCNKNGRSFLIIHEHMQNSIYHNNIKIALRFKSDNICNNAGNFQVFLSSISQHLSNSRRRQIDAQNFMPHPGNKKRVSSLTTAQIQNRHIFFEIALKN